MNSQDILNRYEWRELIEMLPVVQEFFGGDEDSHGLNALMQGLAVYVEKTLAQVDAGKPFVWYNLGFNSELIWALGDVMPITVEALGALHSCLCNSRITKDFIDEAQAVGIPRRFLFSRQAFHRGDP